MTETPNLDTLESSLDEFERAHLRRTLRNAPESIRAGARAGILIATAHVDHLCVVTRPYREGNDRSGFWAGYLLQIFGVAAYSHPEQTREEFVAMAAELAEQAFDECSVATKRFENMEKEPANDD